MARYWYGMLLTDWTFTTVTVDGQANVVQAAGGAPVTFWNAEIGGTQYTDLLDADGVAVTSVQSASDGVRAAGTIPPLRGPDGVREMWASAGGGPRLLMRGRVDAVDRAGDSMTGPLLLADGSPAASQQYALPRSGGTMTGDLTLAGAPSASLHAATKAYVDSAVSGGGSGAVTSVNGQTGAVVLNASHVGAAATSHTHTTSQVTGLDALLADKAALSHDHTNRAAAWRWNGSTYVASSDAGIYIGPTDPGSVPDGSIWIDTSS